MSYGPRSTAGAYRATAAQTGAELPPQRKIALLLAGIIERVHLAESQIRNQQLIDKLKTVDSALSILEALRASLDFEAGGKLAETLASLYDTASFRLVRANAHNDIDELQAVARLLAPIEASFAQIANQTASDAANAPPATEIQTRA